MLTIIKRVDSHFAPVTGVIYGCGTHNQFRKEETPCHCGGTMYPVLPGFTELKVLKD